MKYIFDAHTKSQVDQILAPLKNPQGWQLLNLSFAKFPAVIIRMEGSPGTGKTALANYMARQLSDREPIRISFDGVADPHLGNTEQKIKDVFDLANGIVRKPMSQGKKTKAATYITKHVEPSQVIIMEECDALMWSRDKVDKDTMHMLGFVNTMLTECDKFIQRSIPSLLILTTNYPALLDVAFESRITDVIKLSLPSVDQAIKIWKDKLPENLQKEIKPKELQKLAETNLTPRQIERAILKACRLAFSTNRNPQVVDLFYSLDK